jgi:CDP-diacylglycerol--glycerol-3-phosphate 3-phosphatidyltransferase
MTTLSWPNRITLSRIILVAPFVVCVLNVQDPQWGTAARRAALGILVIMGISDVLDGFLARRLRQETPLGKFLDPLADKLLVICSVVLLARQSTSVPGGILPSIVVVAAIGKDLLVVVGFCIVYLITLRTCISPRRPGKLCTCAQLAMVFAVLLRPDLPSFLRRLPDVCWWTATALAVVAAVDYFRFGQRFVASVAQTGREATANAHEPEAPINRQTNPNAPTGARPKTIP